MAGQKFYSSFRPADDNPYANIPPADDNPYANIPPADDNPYANLAPIAQPKMPTAAVQPLTPAQRSSSPARPPLAAKDPWAGVDVDALRRNAGMAVPTKAAPQAPILDRAVEAYRNAPREAPVGGNAFTDFLPEYAKDIQQSTDTLSTGLDRLSKAPGLFSLDTAQGALETLGGGLGYLMSPVTAASTAIAGNPVERTTGIPSVYTDTAVLTATPGVGVKPLVSRTTQEMVAASPQARRALQNVKFDEPVIAPPPPDFMQQTLAAISHSDQARAAKAHFEKRVKDWQTGVSYSKPGKLVTEVAVDSTRGPGVFWEKVAPAVNDAPDAPEWAKPVNAAIQDLAAKFQIPGKIAILVGDAPIDGKSTRLGQVYPIKNGKFSELKDGADGIAIVIGRNTGRNALPTAIHEMGHALDALTLQKQGPEVRARIMSAYVRQRSTFDPTREQPLNAYRPITAPDHRLPLRNYGKKHGDYVLAYPEWVAEQVSRWITTDKRPVGVVERYFKGAAERWKNLYARLTGNHQPLTEEMREFIEGQWRDDAELFQRSATPLGIDPTTGALTRGVSVGNSVASPVPVPAQSGEAQAQRAPYWARRGQEDAQVLTSTAPTPLGGQPPMPPAGQSPISTEHVVRRIIDENGQELFVTNKGVRTREELNQVRENEALDFADPPKVPTPPGGQPPRGTPLGPVSQNIQKMPPASRYGSPIAAAAKTIEKIFSPSTVDDASRAAANSFRQELGVAARENDIMSGALKEQRDLIDTADQPTRNAFINYVEGRSSGAANPFPALQPLADTWRSIAQKFETQAIPRVDRLTGMSFVQDYFPHLWKDPNAAAQWFEMSGQGRGGFTKKRTLQLYADGLAAGLEPKYPNPVDAMEAYIVNANKYLAHERIFQFGKKNGYIKYLTPKAAGRVAQRLNLVPLKGRLGKTMGGPVSYTAYAPESFARVYNNMVDKGWTGAAGDMTRALRQSANQVTALELGLSGFHALTTAAESTIGRVSNAVTAAARGRPFTAVSELAKAPLAPVFDAVKGAKLRSEYGAPGTGSPMVQKVTDILTRAGARPGKQDEIHFASDRRGYLQGGFGATKALVQGRAGEAFNRMGQAIARTGRDLKDDVTSGFQVPGDYGRRNASSAVVQGLSNVFRVTGNILDTTMAPLFKAVVPTLKNGAMYRMVENFIQAYPNATDAEILEYARRAIDSVDNRFGEMVTENIAYPRYVKEGAQIALRSGSYAYGQIARELGGGAADFLSMPFRKGGKATPLWTEKMSYLVAMPIVSGAAAAATMYAMTGKWPSELMDAYKPQSGGQTEDGDPERINMPGMMKEVIEPFNKGMWEHFKGKMSTFASTATEVATGKDWKNERIAYTDAERAAHPRGEELDPYFAAWAKHVFGKLVPITIRNLAEGQPPGSAITPAMTAFGFQRASKSSSNPERADQYKAYRTKKEMDKKLKEKDRKEQWQ